MAKKAASKTENKVTLKVTLGPEDHKKVKMAAAELEISIADFLRNAAVECAGVALRKYYQREIGERPPSR